MSPRRRTRRPLHAARATRSPRPCSPRRSQHEPPAPPERPPPVESLRERLGPELAAELAAVYAGGPDWTTHAIDALEPLHALARS